MSFFIDIINKMGMDFNEVTLKDKVTFVGGEGVCIEGHRALINCTPSEIVVRIKRGHIKIEGEDLSIKEISEDEVIIFGKISKIERICNG